MSVVPLRPCHLSEPYAYVHSAVYTAAVSPDRAGRRSAVAVRGGRPACADDGPHMVVVGACSATWDGARHRGRSPHHGCVPIALPLSDLANGIDVAMHLAALRNGVRNVAFRGRGTGLDRLSPLIAMSMDPADA